LSSSVSALGSGGTGTQRIGATASGDASGGPASALDAGAEAEGAADAEADALGAVAADAEADGAAEASGSGLRTTTALPEGAGRFDEAARALAGLSGFFSSSLLSSQAATPSAAARTSVPSLFMREE